MGRPGEGGARKGDSDVCGLLEREAEVGVLRTAVDRLCKGAGGAVAIEGPPGIGKTALFEGATGLLAEAGIDTLKARCGEFELDFPFGVARQLLERRVVDCTPKARERLLSGAAAHAAPALGIRSGEVDTTAAPSVDLPFTVIHGLYWLLAKLSEKGPVAVVVDDAHWCDDASLRFLTYLVPRLGELPVLLLVASRPAAPERAAAMGAILGGREVERIVPKPLGEEGSRALLEQALGHSADVTFAQSCHEASGGNPFLLSELATSLRADCIEPVAANVERVRGLVPAAVVNSVLMRIGRMPQACGELAAAVAVLGSEVEPRLAASLSGIGLDDLAGPLEDLERAGIIAPDRPLRFVHPLLREAVRAELPLARREALHAKAAALLGDEGAKAEEIAHHLLNAPRAGSRETVTALRKAATAAVGGGAPEAAVTYLLRALAEPPSADVQAGLRYEVGVAGWLSGSDPGALIDDLRAGLNGAWSPSERATRAIALARAVASTGDVPAAFRVLDGQIEAAGTGAGDAAARLRAEHAALGLLHPDTRLRAIERISERAAHPAGSDIGTLLELSVMATHRSLDGAADESAALAEAALDGGRLLASEGADSVAFHVALLVLMVADHHDSASGHLDQAAEQARRGGSAIAFASVCAMSSVLAWRRGDMPGAEAQARSALEPGLVPPFVLPLIVACLALALIDKGELEAAESELGRFGNPHELPELMQVNMAFFALGALRSAQGRAADALTELAELDRRNLRLGILNSAVPWRPVAVEAALREGDRDRATALAADEMEFAKRWGTPTAMGQALRARGLAKRAEGLDDLREAVTVLKPTQSRREYTLALIDLGSALRRAGERREAREHLAEGLDIAQRSGAARLAGIAHDELRVAGAKPRRLQFSGVDSLTAAERRVADMAAEGLANREIAETLFLSTRTVENHLSRVYRKLDITSRASLGEALSLDPA
ncbi:MAG: AAA family ATPase [Solirubrobacterales bacterium]